MSKMSTSIAVVRNGGHFQFTHSSQTVSEFGLVVARRRRTDLEALKDQVAGGCDVRTLHSAVKQACLTIHQSSGDGSLDLSLTATGEPFWVLPFEKIGNAFFWEPILELNGLVDVHGLRLSGDRKSLIWKWPPGVETCAVFSNQDEAALRDRDHPDTRLQIVHRSSYAEKACFPLTTAFFNLKILLQPLFLRVSTAVPMHCGEDLAEWRFSPGLGRPCNLSIPFPQLEAEPDF